MAAHSLEQTLRVVLTCVSEDKRVAQGIYERLRRETFLDVWFSQQHESQPSMDSNTQAQLAACDLVLICLTPAALVDGLLHPDLRPFLDTMHKQRPGTTPGLLLRLAPCNIPAAYGHWPLINVFEADGYYRLMRTLRKRANEVLLVGQTIDSYTIESMLGQDRLGKVYQGYRSGNPDDSVAMTVLHEWVTAAPDFAQRFEHYVQHIVPLQHSHILPIHEAHYNEQIGQWCIVTNLVTYGTLDTLLEKRTGDLLRLHIGLELARQIAVALSHIHARGIVHGSITPRCIHVARKDRPASGRSEYVVTLGDIGLLDLVGTPAATTQSNLPYVYATLSPEQCRGEPPSVQSDIYALGCMLYLLTTGQMPYDTRTLFEATYNHVNGEPARPRVLNPALPADVETIVLRCLAKEPEHRYLLATDVAQELEQALKHAALTNIAPVPDAQRTGAPATTLSCIGLFVAYPHPNPAPLTGEGLRNAVPLVPGKTTSIPLRLTNHGTRVRSLTLTIDGIPDTWTSTRLPSEIVLKPIDSADVVCTLTPPATLLQAQRTGMLTFRACSDDQQTTATEIEWHVQLVSAMLVRKVLPIVVGVLLAGGLLVALLTGSLSMSRVADTPATVSVTVTLPAETPALSIPTPTPQMSKTTPALLPSAAVSGTTTQPLTGTIRIHDPWGRTIEWEPRKEQTTDDHR